jgi:maltose O-acetyltransferase
MKTYLWRLINGIIQSPLFFPFIRTRMLQILGVKLHPSARIFENVFIGSRKLIMGEETVVNIGSFLDGSEQIVLEDFVRVGPYVKILTGTHKYRLSKIRRKKEDGTLSKKVIIKKGTWVGMDSIILPGVIIEEGCIIAAGSVVLKDTEPNGLYAGNPAKRIKELSTEEDN